MTKYLLLKHYRGAPEAVNAVSMDRWTLTSQRPFKTLATEVEVTKDPRIGWSPTALAEHTRTTYAHTITHLGLRGPTDAPQRRTARRQ